MSKIKIKTKNKNKIKFIALFQCLKSFPFCLTFKSKNVCVSSKKISLQKK